MRIWDSYTTENDLGAYKFFSFTQVNLAVVYWGPRDEVCPIPRKPHSGLDVGQVEQAWQTSCMRLNDDPCCQFAKRTSELLNKEGHSTIS